MEVPAGARTRGVALLVALLSLVSVAVGAETGARVLLEDTFVDNRNGWVEDDNEAARFAVASGAYTLEYKRESGYWISTQPVELGQDDDFEIDAVIDRVRGGSDHRSGLVWGCRPEAPLSFSFFVVSADGVVSAGRQRGDHTVFVLKDVPYPRIQGDEGALRLTVRRHGLATALSVNGFRIGSILSEPPFGGDVGFYVRHPGGVCVRSLRVSATPVPGPTSLSSGAEERQPGPTSGETSGSARAEYREADKALGDRTRPAAARVEKASGHAQRALERAPGDARAHVVAARVALAGGDRRGKGYDEESVQTKALPLIEKALALDPDSADARRTEAEIRLALRDSRTANLALARSLELSPPRGLSFFLLGWYFRLTGRPDAAEKAWAQGIAAAESVDERAALLERVALQFLCDREIERATALLAASLALVPGCPDALRDLGDLQAAAGR
ncbi:MAG: tetratricopeptide repeat protein [Deltaproteobacteria bacterium]|nr:tetratricopeptide repeat protein [Deltaproteobacteria bacterium]